MKHIPALRSAIVNGQWPQVRLVQASNLVDDPSCQLCHESTGTLMHRRTCRAICPQGGWPVPPKEVCDFTNSLDTANANLLMTLDCLSLTPRYLSCVVVVSRHGELLGYGRVVPPPWVRDAAAAEAWAFQVIMAMSPSAPAVVTDCLNIVQTLTRGLKIAIAGKSPFASAWKFVYRTNDMEDFSDEQLYELVWLPAHASAETIGSATMSNGEKVGPLHWRANRLVDLLAKSAARPLRVHSKMRKLIHIAAIKLSGIRQG